MTRARDVSNIDTILTAKGDIYAATAAATPARLGVGSNNQVLTADSTTATGLKWGSVSTTKNFSLLGTGNCVGAGATTVTVSGISGIDEIFVVFNGVSSVNATAGIHLRINTDTGSNYDSYYFYYQAKASYAANNFDATSSLSNTYHVLAVTGSAAGSGVWGTATISGCNTAGKKVITSMASGDTNTNSNWGIWTGGVWNNTATVTSVSVFSNNGNLDAGTFSVYGAA
jgi:hypothetical protein